MTFKYSANRLQRMVKTHPIERVLQVLDITMEQLAARLPFELAEAATRLRSATTCMEFHKIMDDSDPSDSLPSYLRTRKASSRRNKA